MENRLQQLDNVNRRVVLQIFSAYGFGLIKGSIVVHASLTSQKLLTPTFPVNNNELKIASELIWYMDNVILKKLKMSNTSIRVECFHIPANEPSSNERLGYLLLKLKGAQIIDPASNDRVENRSYKLIGSKNCSYNLTMSLRIEDYNVKATEILPKQTKTLKLINNKNININDQNFQKVEEENDHLIENIEIVLPKTDVNVLEMLEHTNISPKKNEPPNAFTVNVQQKLVEELEDWKDKQMILFNEKMEIKEKQLLKEFNNKWLDDRKRIEEELTHEMSKCKAIAESMDKMADMLKEREAIVTTKELELVCQRDSVDNKYIGLMKNLQSSTAQTINELNNQIFDLESKLHGLEKTNMSLRKENEQLKYDINSSCGLRVQQLENTISNLESKYENATKSSMFYKEKWIASVRKVNQMYTKLHENKSNEHLLNNRQNIQNVLTNQFVDRQHDEEKLRKLLNDLGKLRHDMANTNYLDS